VRISIPSALTSYTGQRTEVEAMGETVAALLLDLDRQFPGLRFRLVDEQDAVRTHMRVFVNGEPSRLVDRVGPGDEVAILMALSGG
jgi:molybdopterin converting factor small subunit